MLIAIDATTFDNVYLLWPLCNVKMVPNNLSRSNPADANVPASSSAIVSSRGSRTKRRPPFEEEFKQLCKKHKVDNGCFVGFTTDEVNKSYSIFVGSNQVMNLPILRSMNEVANSLREGARVRWFNPSSERSPSQYNQMIEDVNAAEPTELQELLRLLGRKPSKTHLENVRMISATISSASRSSSESEPRGATTLPGPLVPAVIPRRLDDDENDCIDVTGRESEPRGTTTLLGPLVPAVSPRRLDDDEDDCIDVTGRSRNNLTTSLAFNSITRTSHLRTEREPIGDPFKVATAMNLTQRRFQRLGGDTHSDDTMHFIQKIFEARLTPQDTRSQQGNIFMIYGNPGSGKSTAIKCLSKGLSRAGGMVLLTAMTNTASLQIDGT